jgi:hypothetical protein
MLYLFLTLPYGLILRRCYFSLHSTLLLKILTCSAGFRHKDHWRYAFVLLWKVLGMRIKWFNLRRVKIKKFHVTYCPVYWTWGRAIPPWALHLLGKSQSAEHVCGNNVCRWYTFILLWEVDTCVSRFSQYHLIISLWICTILLFSFSSFFIALPLFTRWGTWSWESKLDLAMSLFWSLFFLQNVFVTRNHLNHGCTR